MSEHNEQVALCQWLDYRGIKYFSVPNGAAIGGRNRFAQMNKLKAEGFRVGAPDLILINRTRRTCSPVAIELKVKGGKQSDEQKQIDKEMVEAGWIYILAYGADEAVRALTRLGF